MIQRPLAPAPSGPYRIIEVPCRIETTEGASIETVARVDTGSSKSFIDQQQALKLGIDSSVYPYSFKTITGSMDDFGITPDVVFKFFNGKLTMKLLVKPDPGAIIGLDALMASAVKLRSGKKVRSRDCS